MRLYEQGLSYRKIAESLAISRFIVSQYTTDYRTAGIRYCYIKGLGDSKLLELLGKRKEKCQKYKDILKKLATT